MSRLDPPIVSALHSIPASLSCFAAPFRIASICILEALPEAET